MKNKVIEKAIDMCGSQKKLALACGVTQATVSYWLRGMGISSQYLLKIEKATNKAITVEEIIKSLHE
ncbi:Uncharacterized protein conserved in bacteria, prophage-related [Phocoenobacter uteri]|uniref:Uncharacterized protein conserved in bacteria, prophage-related n=1 Tax=Phocoenobacter uteri TaxID=146806 RepID=A0A379CB81_9PAST|nr:YdaS family helix-turn-helix protein [Phocoenobacter uteri]MDG6880968.1 hypothetical protein [Phocoenobacter uteri]SUB58985.1 Uncharacterized protein conserved in bacteria, prophage-related [Phocoenobacter uteri]